MKIIKTKVQPMQEFELGGELYRFNPENGWEFNYLLTNAWGELGSHWSNVFDELFEVENPMRMKEWDGIVYREDGSWRDSRHQKWQRASEAFRHIYEVIAHYEGWSK